MGRVNRVKAIAALVRYECMPIPFAGRYIKTADVNPNLERAVFEKLFASRLEQRANKWKKMPAYKIQYYD